MLITYLEKPLRESQKDELRKASFKLVAKVWILIFAFYDLSFQTYSNDNVDMEKELVNVAERKGLKVEQKKANEQHFVLCCNTT